MTATLQSLTTTLNQLGFKTTLEGDPQIRIQGVATLEDAQTGQISFLSNPKYEKALQTTTASAVVLRPEIRAPGHLALLRSEDPYAVITALIVTLHGYRKHRRPEFDGQYGTISPQAEIGPGAVIYPGVTIDDDVVVGRNAVLYPGVYIGPRCRLGDDVTLFANVVIYDDTLIGSRVAIHAGSVIGEDGLGYAPYQGRWVKIPQIGMVEIADDVEIGANCTIDRATLGRTRIGAGTKFSNLIAIGHGTQIGPHCMLVAQVGLAGSVNVGEHVTIAGQAGVVGHIRIGDRATIGAKAGVTGSVPDGETVLGQPAIPIRDMRRQVAMQMRLPKMNDTLRLLEKRVTELEEKLAVRDAAPPTPA